MGSAGHELLDQRALLLEDGLGGLLLVSSFELVHHIRAHTAPIPRQVLDLSLRGHNIGVAHRQPQVLQVSLIQADFR